MSLKSFSERNARIVVRPDSVTVNAVYSGVLELKVNRCSCLEVACRIELKYVSQNTCSRPYQIYFLQAPIDNT